MREGKAMDYLDVKKGNVITRNTLAIGGQSVYKVILIKIANGELVSFEAVSIIIDHALILTAEPLIMEWNGNIPMSC